MALVRGVRPRLTFTARFIFAAHNHLFVLPSPLSPPSFSSDLGFASGWYRGVRYGEALAKLQEERAAREAFEAELEAQTTENIRRVREEERERIRRLEGEKETLMSALSDSKEMKGWLQDKCKTQEAEIASLRDRLAAAEAAASVMQKGPLLPPSP